jgi:hypothetical protein
LSLPRNSFLVTCTEDLFVHCSRWP